MLLLANLAALQALPGWLPDSARRFVSSPEYFLSMPMAMLTLFGLGILLIDLVVPKEWKSLSAWAALMGLVFSAAAVYRIQMVMAQLQTDLQREGMGLAAIAAFGGSLVVDPFAIFFFYLFLAAAGISILMSVKYLEIEEENHGEYYALILFSVVGMMAMAAGYDLILLFIGLELMALSTYVLVGFLRRDRRSNEAALKYLLLGAFSSGILAYGLSLLYGLSGSTNLRGIAFALNQRDLTHDPVAILALLATAAGLFFKIAAVPFHQWAPDAYEGAPTSITAFMSVAGKSAAWALLLRIFLNGLEPLRPLYVPVLIFVAIATMTGGNLAALTQTNLKRLFAYSSIAHVGYMLLGLIAGSPTQVSKTGVKGILVYLLVYLFMNLGAFAVITSLRRQNIIGDEMDDINGLFFKAPVSALLMLAFLLSLAGIPPLAGFYGKYFIFLSLMETGHYVLALLAVVYVAVAMYYYLRIANAMFMRTAADTVPVPMAPGLGVALAITGIASVGIGIYPEPFIRAVNWSLHIAQAPAAASLLR